MTTQRVSSIKMSQSKKDGSSQGSTLPNRECQLGQSVNSIPADTVPGNAPSRRARKGPANPHTRGTLKLTIFVVTLLFIGAAGMNKTNRVAKAESGSESDYEDDGEYQVDDTGDLTDDGSDYDVYGKVKYLGDESDGDETSSSENTWTREMREEAEEIRLLEEKEKAKAEEKKKSKAPAPASSSPKETPAKATSQSLARVADTMRKLKDWGSDYNSKKGKTLAEVRADNIRTVEEEQHKEEEARNKILIDVQFDVNDPGLSEKESEIRQKAAAAADNTSPLVPAVPVQVSSDKLAPLVDRIKELSILVLGAGNVDRNFMMPSKNEWPHLFHHTGGIQKLENVVKGITVNWNRKTNAVKRIQKLTKYTNAITKAIRGRRNESRPAPKKVKVPPKTYRIITSRKGRRTRAGSNATKKTTQ